MIEPAYNFDTLFNIAVEMMHSNHRAYMAQCDLEQTIVERDRRRQERVEEQKPEVVK